MNGKRFDALVVGSGAAGSIAAWELTKRGLDVLLLEAGPDITEADFKVPDKPRQKGINLKARALAVLRGQYIQARIGFFGEQFKHLFVNDRENPYTTPPDDFYLWIRGRQLGGRLHLYGRVLLRMTDYDFKAASRDGFGEDWPISYADLAPYYDRVEEFMGVYGDDDKIPNLPTGRYSGKPKLTAVEKNFKAKVEAKWPGRSVISWRYAAPNLKRIPLGILGGERNRASHHSPQCNRQAHHGRRVHRQGYRCRIHRSSDKAVRKGGGQRRRRLRLHHRVRSPPAQLTLRQSIPTVSPTPAGSLAAISWINVPARSTDRSPASNGSEGDNSAPADPFYGPAGGVYIPRFQNLDSRTHPKFRRGFGVQGAIGRGNLSSDQPAIYGLMGFGETLPYFENCLTIDRRRRDAWGIPSCAYSRASLPRTSAS